MQQQALEDWRAVPSARAIALGLLSTARSPMRVADLVRRAELIGVEGAAMRVALGRLCRDTIVTQVERGRYAIGPGGAVLDRRARSWAGAPQRMRDWHGRWLIIAADHLGRSDRRRVRERERALSLYGFAQAYAGLWVRPDNLVASLGDLVTQMQMVGLDQAAVAICDAQPLSDAAWRALWPVATIEHGYRHWIGEMTGSLSRLPDYTAEEAARETLLLGQSVIRAINRDPLLPDTMVDAALREAVVATMQRYDAAGKECWSRIA